MSCRYLVHVWGTSPDIVSLQRTPREKGCFHTLHRFYLLRTFSVGLKAHFDVRTALRHHNVSKVKDNTVI